MRIARSPAPLPLSSTPAQAWIERASWLVRPGSVVTGLAAVGHDAVRVFVADPYVVDPRQRMEADRLAADSAVSMLEQAAHGVRLIPTTRHFYEGRLRELAPAQLTFATGLPGVQRHDLVPEDVDGDGVITPGEVSHRIEVDTADDAARLDWLLRDSFDEGTVQDGPVRIVVPVLPWLRPGVSGG